MPFLESRGSERTLTSLMPETNSSKHESQAVHKSIKCLGPEESQAWNNRVLHQEVTLPAETHLAKPKPRAKNQL